MPDRRRGTCRPGGGYLLSRFHRHVLVADGGKSRASLIPLSHNYPGFPPGISGEDLLTRLREQAVGYGACIESGRVEALVRGETGFAAHFNDRTVIAHRVVLATGIVDTLPYMSGAAEAIAQGKVRLCAICDGYEVNGDNVVVYGDAGCVIDHALFLRSFTDRVTVLFSSDSRPDEDTEAAACQAGIKVLRENVERVVVRDDGQVECVTSEGSRHCFDIFYSAMGSRMCSDLAVSLGAKVDEQGALCVDAHRSTTVEGLYAVGDMVNSLNQISVAIGEAAICATAVHNSLARRLWCRDRDHMKAQGPRCAQ